MTTPASVIRTREWVELEYGQRKWPEVKKLLEAAIDAEPAPANLARVVNSVVRWEYPEPLRMSQGIVDGRPVQAPESLFYGGVLNFIVNAVIAACTPETELIVELGSGWGRNLASTWLAGGPRDARYVAAEFTQAGREASDVLAGIDPGFRLQSLAFDYNSPDLSALERVGDAVVFTVHSLEQIAHVNPSLFEEIRALGDRVRCLHFEPVGFQVHEGTREGSSRRYALEHGYSLDLVDNLRAAEDAGRLVVEDLASEVVGTNPANSTTYVRWSAPAS
jgi:hypothetical protein